MSVGLNLLPRKVFELVLEDGTTVQGQFGTWATSLFGDKRNLGLAEIIEFFTKAPKISDLLDFVLCAIEKVERKEKKPPSQFFTQMDLCDWMDAYTEQTGEQAVLMKLLAHAQGAEEEKKNPPEERQAGENLSGTQQAPE